jgi:hypothetical protein
MTYVCKYIYHRETARGKQRFGHQVVHKGALPKIWLFSRRVPTVAKRCPRSLRPVAGYTRPIWSIRGSAVSQNPRGRVSGIEAAEANCDVPIPNKDGEACALALSSTWRVWLSLEG